MSVASTDVERDCRGLEQACPLHTDIHDWLWHLWTPGTAYLVCIYILVCVRVYICVCDAAKDQWTNYSE